MTPKAVHQFSISCHYGDGITNGMLFTRRLLQAAGLRSEIFCMEVDPALQGDVTPFELYEGSADQVILIHHGIGNGAEPQLRALPDRKIMVFHNITPSDLFDPDDPIQPLLAQGWLQVDEWAEWLDGAIADSDTNLDILREHGYDMDCCRTIPLLVDLEKLAATAAIPSAQPVEDIFHLLFVGRLMPHKNQLGLVEALAHVRHMTGLDVHLTLVGSGDEAYIGALEQQTRELGLGAAVNFAGKVPDEELADYFSRSDLYVSLSRHEGFGMPLLESMAHCLPVVAFDPPGSNVARTLGSAGLIVDRDEPKNFAALVASAITQPLLRREMVKSGLRELKRFTPDNLYSELSAFFQSINMALPEKPASEEKRRCSAYRIEGPFDSSYSLAIVNRNLALALSEGGHSLSLHSTEGPGDYIPDDQFLNNFPALQELYRKGRGYPSATTILRLMYPTRLTGMNGQNHGLSCYGWEESSLPQGTTDQINCHAHFVTTMSEYVTRTLINNGVNVPIFTTGIGADHILAHEPDASALPDLGPGLRVLHISSCFPRKGVDSLLEAYAANFSGEDDITLIIKTFPNPHHDMDKLVRAWRKKNSNGARIVLINRDLPDSAIRALYEQCHLLVAPSRGEGYGLPMAEAMLHRVPVVTTAYGGQADFCTPDTAWLVDYKFAYADTHMGISDSVWADPDTAELGKTLLELYQAYKSGKWQQATIQRVDRAFDLIDSQHRWANISSRYQEVIDRLDNFPVVRRRPGLACITTWNSKCGIATYSKLLLSPALPDCLIFANSDAELTEEDGAEVSRCWESGQTDSLDLLYESISAAGIEQVLIQFNFSFFGLTAFKRLLARLADRKIDVFITFHSTADVADGDSTKSLEQLLPELQSAARLLVHGASDLDKLKSFGLVENTVLFPHGVKTNFGPARLDSIPADLEGKNIIASYGFLLPHKGVRNLIQAFANISGTHPDAHLLLVNAEYPVEASIQETVLCRRLIQELGLSERVTLITDYLDDTESLAWLSLASAILFPYEITQESSSAAVRWGLTSGKPVYCTPLPIFDDVREVVRFLPGTDVAGIEDGLEEILSGKDKGREDIAARQQQWLRDHDWHHLSNRLYNLLQSYALNGRSRAG